MSPAAGFAVPPIRIVASMMWLVGFAGCYNPTALREGAPCQRSEQCPESQQCVLGSCALHEPPPVDARPAPPPDAMVDAMVDAMPLACVTEGVNCTGGTATKFECGNHCWVKCTASVLRSTAAAACATSWTEGALGEIDDATENGCVNSNIISATFWIGAIQSAAATMPADGWTWNGTKPLLGNYTNWAATKPDDADNVENGAEQCATIRPGGTWDDENCNNQALPFFCRRRL